MAQLLKTRSTCERNATVHLENKAASNQSIFLSSKAYLTSVGKNLSVYRGYYQCFYLPVKKSFTDPKYLNLLSLHVLHACGGPRPIKVGAPLALALEYQELNSMFLFSISFLLCFSAFHNSLFSLSFCLAGPFTCIFVHNPLQPVPSPEVRM